MGSDDEPVQNWPLMFYPTCVIKGPCNDLNSTNVLNVLNLARFKQNPLYIVALNYTNYTGWSRTNVLHTDEFFNYYYLRFMCISILREGARSVSNR